MLGLDGLKDVVEMVLTRDYCRFFPKVRLLFPQMFICSILEALKQNLKNHLDLLCFGEKNEAFLYIVSCLYHLKAACPGVSSRFGNSCYFSLMCLQSADGVQRTVIECLSLTHVLGLQNLHSLCKR